MLWRGGAAEPQSMMGNASNMLQEELEAVPENSVNFILSIR